jgi:hypothetical protein
VNTYIEEAKSFYAKLGDANNFERDLAAYLAAGYVISSPKGIVLTKPVKIAAGPPDGQWWDSEWGCDAWFVKFASGDCGISNFIKSMPYELPFVGWMRALKKKPIRWWGLEQILRRK